MVGVARRYRNPSMHLPRLAAFALFAASTSLSAAELVPDPPKNCSQCAEWNQPQAPFRLFGNSWYVGTTGLSAVLIASPDGLILLDGGVAESAPLIAANIEKLGFRLDQIKLIAVSHAHYDHVGGVAALARASGAEVLASERSAQALQAGTAPADDPQAGFGAKANSFPKVATVRSVADGESVRLGKLAITAHYTPGHTPGATSWTWQACDETAATESAPACLDLVYADSLNAVSDDTFRFSGNAGKPGIADLFRHSIDLVAQLPCDILIPVHPGFAEIDARLARRAAGAQPDPFIDRSSCQRYAQAAREKLDARLAREKAGKTP